MSTRFGRVVFQESFRALNVQGASAPIISRHSLALSTQPTRVVTLIREQKFCSTRRYFSDKASEEAKNAHEAASEQAAATEEAADTKEATAAEEPPAGPSKEEELEAQVKDLKNQVLRSLAEQENTRRIAQRDVDAASQFAIKSFAKALLDVSDNLTRALEAVPEEMRNDKEGNPVLANLYEGIDMTDRGLTKAFQMNGLIKFGKEGDVFDPNKHEALYEYVDPQKVAGTVGQVMKPGFMLRDRVLRPAEVGVIKKA